MNDILSTVILFLVPGVPLLLAFPALRARLSRPCFFALLPAIVLALFLILVPVDFSIKIPWLLFGSGLGIDGMSQMFLTMSVILWFAASLHLYRPSGQLVSHRFTTFVMVTMAGNFGVILSTEIVAFFTFLTLMGYGFYGLLVDGGDESVRRAGRIYLAYMILADLVLFEALLVAASTTDDLSFSAVQLAMPVSSSSGLYLSVVLIGFAAKAGFWPLHFWLSPVFRMSRPAVALLIIGVPIAMGLFGTLRWLPLGEIHSPDLGEFIIIMGATAMLYAVLFTILRAQLKTLPAYIVVFFTGLYSVALGIGLSAPDVWRQYEYLIHVFIILMLISLSALMAIITWLAAKHHYPVAHEKQTDILLASPFFRGGTEGVANQQLKPPQSPFKAKVGAMRRKGGSKKRVISWWKKIMDSSEYFLQRWTIAITLVLLLGIVVAFMIS